jgi:hypothetical protein
MKHRPFDQKLKNVMLWKEIADLHWERLLGDYNNDELFWGDLFHSMEAEDWWDVIDVAKAIHIQHPEELRTFPRFELNIETVEKRLHNVQPVIKQWNRQGYNVAATGLFMQVRDVLNEIADTPTKRWTDKERAKIRADKAANNFLTLFLREDQDA